MPVAKKPAKSAPSTKMPSKVVPMRSRVVEAVGVAVSGSDKTRVRAIEDAMSAAVLELNAKGISDPELVRAGMLEARKRKIAELDAPRTAEKAD